jgi:AraC-like DNA-binding protein
MNHPTALVRSSVLTEYRRLALALGLDPIDLMARANVSQSYLEDRELTLPMSAVVDLFEITAHSSGIQDFGIRLAEMRGLPDLGLITLMLREETDVRTALKSLTAMLHLHSDALYMYLDERGRDPFLSIDIIGPNIGNCRQAIEASVGGGTAILRWLLGTQWNPAQVSFRHDRPLSTAKHEQLFRCPLSFAADFNGVVLHASDVQRKLPPTSPVFRRHIERLVHGLAQSSSESYVHRVNQVVTMLLPQGDATAANSARLLGTSSRTLHRNLARANTNFSKLLDQLRRDRVVQCMTNRYQSLTDIAGQMGFGSLSAFSRWFVDTFGQSPREWRKDQIGQS